jgi:hypothetical protein
MMLFVPESPRYLVAKGKFEEASKALARFRGAVVREQVDPELTAVSLNLYSYLLYKKN